MESQANPIYRSNANRNKKNNKKQQQYAENSGKKNNNNNEHKGEVELNILSPTNTITNNEKKKNIKKKKRRDSEAHSIAIFSKTLGAYGIEHEKKNKKAISDLFVAYPAVPINDDEINTHLKSMPKIEYLNTVVYSIAVVLVLLVSSYMAYASSKNVVSAQFQTISDSACRTAKHNVQSTLDIQILLTKQLSNAIGRHEGFTKFNTNYFMQFPGDAEYLFRGFAEIFGAKMVYFGSSNNTFIGFNVMDDYVGIRDESTNMKYVKYSANDDDLKLRNTSKILDTIPTFQPRLRPWYLGAMQNYAAYKASQLLSDESQRIKLENIKPHVTDIYVNAGTTDDFIISVAMPVVDAFTDEFLGVAAMDIPLGNIGANLNVAKTQAFPHDIDDGVIIAVVAKSRDGDNIIIACTDSNITETMKKHNIDDRTIEEVSKYDNLSPKAIDFLTVLKNVVNVDAEKSGILSDDTHSISKDYMENRFAFGLEQWSFYIITKTDVVQAYSYIAANATNIFGAIMIIAMFASTWAMNKHVEGSNNILYRTECYIIDYFNSKRKQDSKILIEKKKEQSKEFLNKFKSRKPPAQTNTKKAINDLVRSKVVQEDVDELNKYYFVLNPSIYTKYFTAFILLISIINISIWFSSGEKVIIQQVDTLVFDLSVEIKTKLDAYLAIPVGFVRLMGMFNQLDLLPSGMFDFGSELDRADAGNIGMLLAYPKYNRPGFCYIGTEEDSFIGAESVPENEPFGIEVMSKDNTTGRALCNDVPFLQNYELQRKGINYLVRNSSAAISEKKFADYHPIQRPWYIAGKANPYKPVWSPVYEFAGVIPPTMGITATFGFNHSQRKNEFFGAAAADFTLSQLNNLLQQSVTFALAPLEDGVGTAYLVERDGHIVAVSSDVPVNRKYSKEGLLNRIHARDLCNRRERYPDECDVAIHASYTELEDRLESGFFENGLLAKNYPNGLEMEVGRGGEVGIMMLRLASIQSEIGLDWILVSGFGKRSFLATFARLKDLYLITSMFLTLIILFAGFFFSYSRYNSLYGKKKLKSNAIKEEEEEEDDGDDDDEKDEEDANISETLHTIFKTDKKVLDPDSEEFFNQFRETLAPTVLSANMVCRLKGTEARPPKVYDTFRRLLLDNKEKATRIFKQFDANGDGEISRREFIKGLTFLGYQPTQAEAVLLFAALDKDGDGKVSYEELIEDDNVVLMEPEATLAEKERALEYVLMSQNAECNILDFLYFQRDNDVARVHGYRIFHSKGYGIFISCSIILNLCLAFFEAPATRENYFTIHNNKDRIFTLSMLTIVSILLYAVDLAFEIYLFGIYQPDRTLKEARKVKASTKRARFDDINERNTTHQLSSNKLIIAKIIILLSFLIDAMIPYYTGCDDINLPCNDESVTQIVFLLPYTALLRPIWPMLRFSAIRITLIAFVRTVYHARAVFIMFLITLFVFAIIGTTLLSNRHSYDTFDSFQSVYKSFSTLFVYMVSAENYPDVVYPPTLCPNASEANTRDGGVISAECPDTYIHFYTFLTSLFGTFLIVSLIIAAFEDGFATFMSKNRINQKIKSRMAIIAAFIILDKDAGGSLDKVEFLKFFNLTCNTGRLFNVDDDFELSGADFIQLCEELVHEMKSEALKEMHLIEFGEAKYNFDTCSPEVLFGYLRTLDIDFLPPEGTNVDPSNPKDLNVIEYWRHRGADYYQEHERQMQYDTGGGSSSNSSVTSKAKQRVAEKSEHFHKLLIKFYKDDRYLITITCLLLANVCSCCVYGAASNEYIPYIDILNIIFVIFWFLECLIKIYLFGYDHYVHVNDDFFKEVKNIFDGSISTCSFFAFVTLAIYRTAFLNLDYIFDSWKECTSEANCEVNDWARIVLSLNALRLFGEFEMVRKIIFCFYVIVPNYFAIIQLTVLFVYTYAIWGCMSFGGTFKYLHNYDMGQANFNSMSDSIITLIQLYVGEAWNGVMLAAVDSVGSNAYPFFFSYVLISTMLLTNLLVGVIISGFGITVAVQKHAENKRMSKIPTLLIVRALKEGKISEPRLDFKYGKNKTVRMLHNLEMMEKIEDKKQEEKYQLRKIVKRAREKEKQRILELTISNQSRAYKFKRLVEKTKDEFGFYTLDSRELIARYAMIILEEEEEEEAFAKHLEENRINVNATRRSSMVNINLQSLGIE